MAKGRGKAFEGEMKRGLDEMHPAGFTARFTDAMYGVGKSVKSNPDIITTNERWSALIECKAAKGTSVPLVRLADHQLDALLNFEAIGPHHHAYVAVNFYNGKLGKERVNRAFLVPVLYWAPEWQEGRKSLSLKWCEKTIPTYEMKWVTDIKGWLWV